MLKPNLYLPRIVDLEPAFLQKRQIGGLLLDIDGTLKNFHDDTIAEPVIDWIERIRRSGIRMCLLSNGKSGRIGRLAAEIDLPFFAQALKPFPFRCRRAAKQLGLPNSKVALAGDQIFADVLAGSLAGLYTILVRPTSLDEPWFTRLKRPFEKLVLRNLEFSSCSETDPR